MIEGITFSIGKMIFGGFIAGGVLLFIAGEGVLIIILDNSSCAEEICIEHKNLEYDVSF
ncbi:MAG: hypothetical protein MRK02_01745 [Candidatus Scalindua sp.]|nr:hypothetical protein [Candidatus Scalindua sp.]